MTRLLVEFGMGTSLRRGDYTQAAMRGVKDALWHNSINLAELFGFEKTDMQIRVDIGVQQPDQVDVTEVLKVFPYGHAEVVVHHGGLDIARPEGEGNPTIMANVALTVGFDMERGGD
ncbi:Lin0512 family protein [Roseobacter sinensis]|uniref:Lin0512 family protein n=1 Tax=Roseobacter sinensis TaxID=2931391 RepID=A0ABT3BFW1_9RHOB|nr:Lin0512 family protein [Roseobacter sp. WL0113]MCV3272443.1 Lin0512 family protein [Roseobacter sp. WL0113]